MAVVKRRGHRTRPWVDDYRELLPDGSWVRRTRWFRTQAEAKAHEEWRLKSQPTGRPTLDPASTVREVAERFLATVRATARYNTYLCYQSNLDSHLLPRFGSWKMREWSRGALKELLAEKLTAPVVRALKDGQATRIRATYAPETVGRILSTASALASYAVDAEILKANPFFRLGKALKLTATKKARQNRVQKKAMTRDQLRVYLGKVVEVAPRSYALFLLLARAGLRLGEALALRVSDIDFDARTVHVEREKVKGEGKWVLGPPKSEHGVRDVNMSPQLTAVLRRVVEVERAKDKLRRGWKTMSPWVFYADRDPDAYAHETDGTLDDSNVRRVMRRVLAALPADFPKHFTPHGARHTFASLLSAEGKDIQYIREQLGHESIKLTADTYGGWLCRKDQHASDCLDDPDWDSVTTQG